MGKRIVLVVALAVSWAALAASSPALAQDAQDAPDAPAGDAETREWEQEGGGPDHACVSSMVPVAAQPTEAWRVQLGGPLAAEPVAWSGIVYVVVRVKRGLELSAFRVEDGERVGKRGLGDVGGTIRLAVSNGVAIVNAGGVRGFPLRPDGFGMGWRCSSAEASRGLLVRGGEVIAASYSGLTRLAATTGKVLQKRECDASDALCGAVVGGYAASRELVFASSFEKENYKSIFTRLDTISLDRNGELGSVGQRETDMIVSHAPRFGERRWGAWVAGPLATDPYGSASALFVLGPGYPAATGPDAPSAMFKSLGGGSALCSIATRPAVADSMVYGFTNDGALISALTDGKFFTLVEAGKLPSGARPGPATLVQNVLCFGNWAVDKDSKRVLWCLPELDAASPAIPVADGRMVVATDGNDLICLADTNAVPADSAAEDEEPTAGTASPVRSPEALEGVILADGTIAPGKVEVLATGGARVTPAAGAPQEFAASNVSVAIAAGKVVLRGEQFGAYDAWEEYLRAQATDAFEELAKKAAGERLHTLARRLAAEARAYGLDDARAQRLDRSLAGSTEHPNSALKLPRHEKNEDEVRTRLRSSAVAASTWLSERGLPVAASAALALAERFQSDVPDTEERAAALVPESFPWRSESDAPLRWLRWSREVLPAGADFLDRADAAWGQVRSAAAWGRGTIGLRTRNLLLFSRCDDPATVGACLRNGEGAIRALDALLRDGASSPVKGDLDRLEVRLHANREDYLAERPPGGEGAMEWSAGYYSPGESVSRFYVPTEEETAAARGRSLFKVLAHELTHHYVDRRATVGDRGDTSRPGYWIVEGIARFVEEQTVEMGRRGLRFDDATVAALDVTSQLDLAHAIFAPAKFVDLSRRDFAALGKDERYDVAPRNTLVRYKLSPLSVFYAQAGATVYFMMHRRGPEGRAALLSYLRGFYAGKSQPNAWKALGFADAAEFEREFKAFLKSLRD